MHLLNLCIGGCSSDIASLFYFWASKVAEHVTSRVGETSLKQNKRNLKKPNPNPNLVKGIITFIVFHNKIYVFIIIFTAFSFLRLIHGLFTIWGGNVS